MKNIFYTNIHTRIYMQCMTFKLMRKRSKKEKRVILLPVLIVLWISCCNLSSFFLLPFRTYQQLKNAFLVRWWRCCLPTFMSYFTSFQMVCVDCDFSNDKQIFSLFFLVNIIEWSFIIQILCMYCMYRAAHKSFEYRL